MRSMTLLMLMLAVINIAATQGPGTPQKSDPRNGAVMSKLIYIDIDTAIEDVSIQDLVQSIGQICDIPTRTILQSKTQPAGIDPACKISLPEASSRPALNLLQDAIAQCSESVPATWQIQHGQLVVSTKEVLGSKKQQILRILPIEDLLQPVPDYNDPPNLNLGGGGGGAGGGGSGGGAGGGQGGPAGAWGDLETRRNEVIELIVRNIEPGAWIRTGGTWAEIQPWRRSLLIRAPRWIHRQIQGFDYRIPVPRGRTARTLRQVGSDVRVEVPLSERLRNEYDDHS